MEGFLRRALAALMVLSMLSLTVQPALADDVQQATPILLPAETPAGTPEPDAKTGSTPETAGTPEPDAKTGSTPETVGTPEPAGTPDPAGEAPLLMPMMSRSGLTTFSLDTPGLELVSGAATDNGDGTWDVSVELFLDGGLELTTGETFDVDVYVNSVQGEITAWSTAITTSDPTLFSASWSGTGTLYAGLVLTSASTRMVDTAGESLSLSFQVSTSFFSCRDNSVTTYSPTITLDMRTFSPYSNVEVDLASSVVCPGIPDPVINWMDYDSVLQDLIVQIMIPMPMTPGQSLTISYDPSLFSAPTYPVPVQMFNYLTGRNDTIGSISASGGVLTFLVTGSGNDWDYDGYTNEVNIPMLLAPVCAPGDLTGDIGDFVFEASSGESVSGSIDGILCNADPVTKTGSWKTDDEGEPYIEWVIDTGDLLPPGALEDSTWFWDSSFDFDCDLEFEVVPAPGTTVTYKDCTYSGWWVHLDTSRIDGTDTVRAVITVAARPYAWGDWESTSFVNCVDAYSLSSGDSGWDIGHRACAELFPPDAVGDVITKSVDKDVAQPGDTISYTIEVQTSSANWDSIDLTDEIPSALFEIDTSSITCSVVPSEFEQTPCFEFDAATNMLKVKAVPSLEYDDVDERWYAETGPVTITVTFSGVVPDAAPAGATITNQACSLRSVSSKIEEGSSGWTPGDPSVVGSGVICDTASTTILGAVVPVVTFTEATCITDAGFVAEPVDGVAYSIVSPATAGEPFSVTASIDPTSYVWGDYDSTVWTPVTGDAAKLMASHTFADKPDCSTVTPTPPAPTATPTPPPPMATPTPPPPTATPTPPPPMATPTPPAPTATPAATPVGTPPPGVATPDPTPTVGVTELPKTGSDGGNGSAYQTLVAVLLIAALVTAGGTALRRSGGKRS